MGRCSVTHWNSMVYIGLSKPHMPRAWLRPHLLFRHCLYWNVISLLYCSSSKHCVCYRVMPSTLNVLLSAVLSFFITESWALYSICQHQILCVLCKPQKQVQSFLHLLSVFTSWSTDPLRSELLLNWLAVCAIAPMLPFRVSGWISQYVICKHTLW